MMFQNSKFKIQNSQRGIAVLSMVIIIIAVMAIIGIAIATTSFFESSSGSGEEKSEEALRVADAGVQDAMVQLARNIDFQCTSVICTVTANCTAVSGTDGYSLAVGNGTACIQVTNPASCPDSANTIIVKGTVGSKIRKIKVTYDLNCYGALTQTAWLECTTNTCT